MREALDWSWQVQTLNKATSQGCSMARPCYCTHSMPSISLGNKTIDRLESNLSRSLQQFERNEAPMLGISLDLQDRCVTHPAPAAVSVLQDPKMIFLLRKRLPLARPQAKDWPRTPRQCGDKLQLQMGLSVSRSFSMKP